MTWDERSTRSDDPQRVIDALGDLFDCVASSERTAAEEELRDAGRDPRSIGQRCADTAAGALGSAVLLGGSPRSTQRHPERRAQRAATVGPAGDGGRRSVGGGEIARAVGALLVGIAIGWMLARATPPLPPGVQSARQERPPSSSEQRPSAMGRGASETARVGQRPLSEGSEASGGATVGRDDAGPPSAEERQRAAGGMEALPAPSARGGGEVTANSGQTVTSVETANERGGGKETVAGSTDRWVLDQSDWSNAETLLPAPILQHVKTGEYWFTVQSVPSERFTRSYPNGFWSDSQANAQRYDVDPSTCALKEAVGGAPPTVYVGLPFPAIADSDPSAGCKIMWNAGATSAFDGGQEAELSFDQTSGAATSGGARRLLLELHALALQGRRSGPIAGSDTLRSAELLRATAPSDLGETAFLTIRSNDPAERDREWAFVPAQRRVRALNPANRSDGLLGSDLSQDQLHCFDGKLEDFEWRLIGKQTILAPLTSVQPIARTALSAARAAVAVPSPKAAFEVEGATGAPWLIVQGLVMVPRPVWVVEGVPRDQYYAYGKLVLYVDAELYRPYWQLAFGRNGEYVAHAMCAQHWSRSADGVCAGATAGTVMAVNEPLRRGTLMRYRSQVIDQELDRDFFTVAKMIEITR